MMGPHPTSTHTIDTLCCRTTFQHYHVATLFCPPVLLESAKCRDGAPHEQMTLCSHSVQTISHIPHLRGVELPLALVARLILDVVGEVLEELDVSALAVGLWVWGWRVRV